MALLGSLGLPVTDLQRTAPVVVMDPSTRGFRAVLDPSRHQPEAVERVVEALTASPYGGGGCLCLPVGYGKTVCALAVACRVAERVLVLVHTDVLARQWADRVASLVEGATVTLVKPRTFSKAGTTTHTIMLMQTLLARAKSTIASEYDLVIVDETHHLAAPTLSRCMALAGSRYRLGLSATLERKDGMHVLITHVLGPVAYAVRRTTNPNVTVRVHTYEGTVDHDDSVTDAITSTASDARRTDILAGLILGLYSEGRGVIVMSDRKVQLRALETMLRPHVPLSWAVGGSPPVSMAERPVVLATFAYCAEGMDIPELDSCVLATSRRDVRQCVGRILRQHPDTASRAPCVVDLVDTRSRRLASQAAARRAWYTRPLNRDGLAATVISFRATHRPGRRPIDSDHKGDDDHSVLLHSDDADADA
jgi:superfamily II DNA or RNA helicase